MGPIFFVSLRLQLAAKANAAVKDIDRVIIWGNHSANQYPDIHHARIGGCLLP